MNHLRHFIISPQEFRALYTLTSEAEDIVRQAERLGCKLRATYVNSLRGKLIKHLEII